MQPKELRIFRLNKSYARLSQVNHAEFMKSENMQKNSIECLATYSPNKRHQKILDFIGEFQERIKVSKVGKLKKMSLLIHFYEANYFY